MRLLVVVLSASIIVSLCEARHPGKHEKHHEKAQHLNKGHHHGNHKNSATNIHHQAKLDIHRADGCDCPPDHMCVNGKATTGQPICVSAEFIKEGRHLMKEFNEHRSKGFQLKDKEPKPHLFNKHRNHHIQPEKPHNVHISVHAKPSKYDSYNRVQGDKIARSKHVKKTQRKHKKAHTKAAKTCSLDDMKEMRTRLTGWFRLLHAQDRESHPHHRLHRKHKHHLSVKKELRNHHNEGHCKCLRSVIWELHHLDQNNDHHLNQTELQEIERNNMEPCLRPYLDSCDHNKDTILSKNEWCCCFSEVLPPCYSELRSLQEKVLANEKDLFLPRCDHEGFYAKEQCTGHHDSRKCWCVDLNGNKIDHTERHGKAHCGKYNALGHPKYV